MWHELCNNDEVAQFMDEMYHFHDSCIKELYYVSGAYVNQNLSMKPVNDRRVLKVILQRQFSENSMIELEFSGLKSLQLSPTSEDYTCEILGCGMFFKEGFVYWFDGDEPTEKYSNIIICAENVRWRPIMNCMGSQDFFIQKNS